MLFLSLLLGKMQLLLKILGLHDFPLPCGRSQSATSDLWAAQQSPQHLASSPAISGLSLALREALHYTLLSALPLTGPPCHSQICFTQAEQFFFAIPNASVNNTDKTWPVQPESLVSGTPRSAVHVRNTSQWSDHCMQVSSLFSVRVQTLPAPLHPHLYFFLLWQLGTTHSFVVILGYSHSSWHGTPV